MNENIVREERLVSDFNGVVLRGIGALLIQQGEREALTIEAEQEIMPLIQTEVKNHQLVIEYKSMAGVHPTRNIRFHISMKAIAGIEISGAGSAEASRVTGDLLRIVIGGAGEMDLGGLAVNRIEIQVSGSGKLNLKGRADQQDLHVSGAGTIRARDLATQDARVVVSGSGSVTLNVQRSLDVMVSGVGNVEYLGMPKVTRKISGVATLRQLSAD